MPEHRFETPNVYEVPLHKEPFTPDNFIEQVPVPIPPEAQRALFHYKLAWNNNELQWLPVKNAWLNNVVEVTDVPDTPLGV